MLYVLRDLYYGYSIKGEIMTIINKINSAIQNDTPISDEIITLMLTEIGSIDPVLRDNTIYLGFCNLFETEHLNLAQKNVILNHVLTENKLFLNIDGPTSDSVFARSFTSLLMVILLEDHYKKPWIASKDEKALVMDAVRYFRIENDNRGFVEEKGWAHAFAHGADLIASASRSVYFQEIEVVQCLEATRRALVDVGGFLYGEEGRLAKASTNMRVYGKLNDAVFAEWLGNNSRHLDDLQQYEVCWKNYLLALNFTLMNENVLGEKTERAIKMSLNLFYKRYRSF